MNILITGIGGPTPRSIAKTIRRLHPEYKLIGIDANPKAIGFFMPELVDKHYVAPRVNESNYWPFIEDLLKTEEIDLSFVQPEAEVIGWGKYFESNKKYPSPVVIPPVEIAMTLMDKSKMAEILEGTEYIPKTVKISQQDFHLREIETTIGYPCWIRAIKGSGGLASLKVENRDSMKSWLFINREISEFTVSEYLPGRHLATQMLYLNGDYIKGAALECIEYVMANISPSKVTGNTSFGRFINEQRILEFCDNCIEYISQKLGVKPHGVLSFDLKEDKEGNLKVTEVNIRHMAYTGVMAQAGFDLVNDTIEFLTAARPGGVMKKPYFTFDKPYLFLRDVDTEPVLLDENLLNAERS